MKKRITTTILLSFILTVSFCFPAFAQESNTITPTKELEVVSVTLDQVSSEDFTAEKIKNAIPVQALDNEVQKTSNLKEDTLSDNVNCELKKLQLPSEPLEFVNGYIPEDLPEKNDSDASDMPQISPRHVIGADDRVRVENTLDTPYHMIGYLVSVFPQGQMTRGTGWLFGSKAVVTAAHCLYNTDFGGYATKVAFFPAYDNDCATTDMSYGYSGAETFQIPSSYVENPNVRIASDIGVIKLTDPLGDTFGYFGAASFTEGSLTNQYVYTSGYPSQPKGWANTFDQWKTSGTIFDEAPYNMFFMFDLTEGASGSPIYQPKGGYTSLGVATGGGGSGSQLYNYGTRITSEYLKWMVTFR